MTFEEAHQNLLREFDIACSALRDLHEDRGLLNEDATDYQKALGKLSRISRDIFTLKDVWYGATDGKMT